MNILIYVKISVQIYFIFQIKPHLTGKKKSENLSPPAHTCAH